MSKGIPIGVPFAMDFTPKGGYQMNETGTGS